MLAISLLVVSALAQQNIVQNGGFEEGDMNGWAEFKHNRRANGLHVHNWGNGRGKTAHLHGHCFSTDGGMSQRISFDAGGVYELKFTAFSGDWDGRDTDSMVVGIDNGILQEKEYGIPDANSVQRGRGKVITLQFEANQGSNGMLYFWSGIGHCIDIDDVSIVNKVTTTTTTTATTATETTTVTTQTRTTTTNTLEQAIAKLPKLSDVEKMIEKQIAALKAVSDGLADRVAAVEKENAGLKAANVGLTDDNKKLNAALAKVQSALAGVTATTTLAPTTPVDVPPFSFTCDDTGDASDCTPQMEANGKDLNVAACCGAIAFHSTECSVNPCRLLADVEDLKLKVFP